MMNQTLTIVTMSQTSMRSWQPCLKDVPSHDQDHAQTEVASARTTLQKLQKLSSTHAHFLSLSLQFITCKPPCDAILTVARILTERLDDESLACIS